MAQLEQDVKVYEEQEGEIVDECVKNFMDRYNDFDDAICAAEMLRSTWDKVIEKLKSQKEKES